MYTLDTLNWPAEADVYFTGNDGNSYEWTISFPHKDALLNYIQDLEEHGAHGINVHIDEIKIWAQGGPIRA